MERHGVGAVSVKELRQGLEQSVHESLGAIEATISKIEAVRLPARDNDVAAELLAHLDRNRAALVAVAHEIAHIRSSSFGSLPSATLKRFLASDAGCTPS